jgi:hypothetical protein
VTAMARPRSARATFVLLTVAAAPPVAADVTRALSTRVDGVAHAWTVIADSSEAAGRAVPAREPFDPARRYARAGCVPGRIYWSRGGVAPPECTSTQWVDAEAAADVLGLRCDAARAPLATSGWHAAGRLRQWDAQAAQWTALEAGERGAIECEDDRGRHGAVPGRAYAADGGPSPWSDDARAEIAWPERPERYVLYDAAYVAWWHGQPPNHRMRWHDAQRAAWAAAWLRVTGSVTVLRHDWNSNAGTDASTEGGMVLVGPASILERRRLDAAWLATPLGGAAPLTETLDEAARVILGLPPRYGLTSHAAPGRPQSSAPESLIGTARYRSPLAARCIRAELSLWSAAAPAQDAGALAGNGLGLDAAACRTDVPGACAGAFARALDRLDLAPDGPRGRLGVQWLAEAGIVRTIDPPGLRPTPIAAEALARLAAERARARLEGSGAAIVEGGAPALTAVTANGPDAFATWTTPSPRTRWRGGLRRLAGDDGGARDAVAPPPERRRVMTDVAGPDLGAAGNAVAIANLRLTAADLGLLPADERNREALVAWARGHDVDDRDGDGDRAESRRDFGAMIGAPAVVRYATGRTLVFAGSSDGFLHAFAGATEVWAFVPRAFLPHLAYAREAAPGPDRLAGLDGDLRVLAVDVNADRRIDGAAGDRAVLLFGLRRGGRAYYAVDVTVPDAPRVLWRLGPRDLPSLGQTWAAPVPVRLTIAGARQRAGRHVVLLAGGHDPAQDDRAPRSRDRVGAALYLVDAWTGDLLWHAGGGGATGAAPDVAVPSFDYAIAATPRALDLDGDGELDRAYVADTGGQVFRIDFTAGAARDRLARIVRLAALGGAGARDRRFYAEPDVALVRRGPGAPYVAITLGSGFAPNPHDSGVADRLYSLRDTLPDPTRPARAPTVVTDDELPDATAGDVATGRPWKRRLTLPGERILVPARTVDHRVIVPAWRPAAAPSPIDANCALAPGGNRVHVVDVRDGRSLAFRVIDAEEREDPAELSGAGVVPGAAFVATPPPAGCRGRCASRLHAQLGAARIEVDWPGSLVRSGWVERGRP